MSAPDKKTVISTLEKIAVLLELSGANPFKSRAFQNGARSLQSYEGDLAEGLGALQGEHPDVSLGSYPFFYEGDGGKLHRGVNLVARGIDAAQLNEIVEKLAALSRSAGGDPVIDPEGAR